MYLWRALKARLRAANSVAFIKTIVSEIMQSGHVNFAIALRMVCVCFANGLMVFCEWFTGTLLMVCGLLRAKELKQEVVQAINFIARSTDTYSTLTKLQTDRKLQVPTKKQPKADRKRPKTTENYSLRPKTKFYCIQLATLIARNSLNLIIISYLG